MALSTLSNGVNVPLRVVSGYLVFESAARGTCISTQERTCRMLNRFPIVLSLQKIIKTRRWSADILFDVVNTKKVTSYASTCVSLCS